MKRLERLTALLSFLQSKRYTPLVAITQKFQISERTVFRDIRTLEEAGVPISFEKGKGYFIVDRYFLPPLAFTLDEAKSFIFVEQLARKYVDQETFRHYATALEKIKNKLRGKQLEDIESLESRVGAYIHPEYSPKYLHVSEQACAKKQILQLRYKDIKGVESNRKIEPIGITFYSQSWHLIAYCQLREDYRDFSLNRVIELRPTTETFFQNHLTLSEYIQKLENS